ncbi:hypothetical protein ACFLYB_01465 [Chloroflexota bacterium]
MDILFYIILIPVIALIIVLVLLTSVREQGKQYSKPSKLAILGITLVVFGIVLGKDTVVGYPFLGIGVLLAIVGAYRNRKK